MADQRHFEAGFGQFSKSGWVQSRRNNSKQSKKETQDWEMTDFTGDGLFEDAEGMTDAEDKYAESSDLSASSDHWSLPWSDLMMTLFVLFAVLLSVQVSERNVVSAAQAKVEVGLNAASAKSPIKFPSGEVAHTPEKIYRLSSEAIRLSNLEQIKVVFETDLTVRISVMGPLFFDAGTAAIRAETKQFLDKLLPIFQAIDNEIHVIGHTDDVPLYSTIYPSNWELSSARAASVAKYLIRSGPLEPGRFSVIGRSMYRPDLPNLTKKNRQLNRRVDIIITRLQYDGI